MIITIDEYREMGFTDAEDSVLDSCLKRAEYTLAGLTEGRVFAALEAGGKAAEYVKQAAGFQTSKLVNEELNGEAAEKVSIGDFSYSVSPYYDSRPFDMSMQAIGLLKAAGCLFGGREVRG